MSEVPEPTGSTWRRYNEFGGVEDSVSAVRMADNVRRTIKFDALGEDSYWRYEFDPGFNRVEEAVYAEVNELGYSTTFTYTRPRGGVAR